ncbi:MAG: SGNH/GDSL hydrolase family protein [Planctomycetes bacterium]|nr:SGNH/GDSL hydrolase family protein [Planctomycetota bacterium]
MDSRRGRWLALAISSAVSLLILWFGVKVVRDRQQGSVLMQHGDFSEPVDRAGARNAGDALAGRELDPEDPQRWRFHLSDAEVEKFFALSSDTRLVNDPWTATRFVPGLNDRFGWREHPDGEFWFRTNGIGLREDGELASPPNDIRILVAGDSHTCGLCNNSENFCSELERKLGARRPGRSIEALNTGIGGYHFLNYLGTLYRFRSFEPQVFVCTIFGGNDFTEFYWLYLHFTQRRPPAGTGKQYRRIQEAASISPDACGQGLAALDLLRNYPDERRIMVFGALQMCLEMQRAAAVRGTDVVFVHIPSPFEFQWKKPEARYVRARDALGLEDEDFEILSDLSNEFFAGLRAKGLRVVDMRSRFAAEPEPPYWRADFHINIRGHELIADELTPVIDELLAQD